MPEVPNRRGVDMVLPPVYSPKREYPFAGPACAGECQPLDVSPILLEEEAALTGAVFGLPVVGFRSNRVVPYGHSVVGLVGARAPSVLLTTL